MTPLPIDAGVDSLPPGRAYFKGALRLRRHAQVRPEDLVALGELLLGVLVGNGRRDDAVAALLPVDGRRHSGAIAELEGVHDAEDLVEVAADGRGVGDLGADLFLG